MTLTNVTNSFGQPVGEPVAGWTPPAAPRREPGAWMQGRYCQLEALADRDAPALHAANSTDDGRMWTYLPYGPFDTLDAYRSWVASVVAVDDPLFYAVIEADSGLAIGVASYLRIDPPAGSIEVGHIAYSPKLQRTRASTEAMYLMMRRAFELGYRRYEWKCDALNAPSRAAAIRLGFSYEGIFRQARVNKGRNRDTAWFAAIDREWPALNDAYQQWLDPSNFDRQGQQRTSLRDLTRNVVQGVP